MSDLGQLCNGYCCKTRPISIAGLRCQFLGGLLFGSSFVGVAVQVVAPEAMSMPGESLPGVVGRDREAWRAV